MPVRLHLRPRHDEDGANCYQEHHPPTYLTHWRLPTGRLTLGPRLARLSLRGLVVTACLPRRDHVRKDHCHWYRERPPLLSACGADVSSCPLIKDRPVLCLSSRLEVARVEGIMIIMLVWSTRHAGWATLVSLMLWEKKEDRSCGVREGQGGFFLANPRGEKKKKTKRVWGSA